MFAWHNTPWMWLSMVVLWSLLAVLAYFAIRGWSHRTRPHTGPRAVEILEQRLARGEISVEEYRERRETLTDA